MTFEVDWDAATFRRSIAEVLDGFVDSQADRLAPLGPDATRLLAAARDALSGGKRLRGMFCFWGFWAVRRPRDEAEHAALLRAAAALEVLHASALVHDDLMDASDTRRGRPAAHRAFEAEHHAAGWRAEARDYGAAAAILLGDLLLSWADELLRTAGFDDERTRAALDLLDQTRSEVIVGQFLDVSSQARGDSEVEQSMRVLRYKSAKYSVERPLELGARLAGGPPELIGALCGFGLPLGEAFQLRDDLLGVFGDPVQTGKPAGDDLSEGKRTVLVAIALANATPQDAARLDHGLGRPLSGREVVDLQRIIEACGAHAEIERRITELTRRSLAALDQACVDPAAAGRLRELAAAATQRVV